MISGRTPYLPGGILTEAKAKELIASTPDPDREPGTFYTHKLPCHKVERVLEPIAPGQPWEVLYFVDSEPMTAYIRDDGKVLRTAEGW